jgi:hypothetical protein
MEVILENILGSLPLDAAKAGVLKGMAAIFLILLS